MFSPPHRIRFLLFTILMFRANSTSIQVKDIIEKISKEKEIQTIAFFGDIFKLESVLPEADASIPRMVYTESYGDLYFSGSFNRNILIVASINLWHRSMLNRIDIAFRGMHIASKSVYLVTEKKHRNMRYLAEHFEWCWAKGFVNVLVVFTATDEIFSYTPFPEIRIIRGTLENPVFPDGFSNLMGYPIRTPLQNNPPRVFEYTDPSGISHVTGYCAELFVAFLQRYNATMQVVRVNNSTDYDLPAIVKLIREGFVDISIHTFMDLDGIRSSYPVRMMQWCIMVPFRGEIKGYLYFIRPFQYYLWLSCSLTALCIAFYVTLEECCGGTKYDFGRSFCEVFRFMLCLPITDARPFAARRAFRRMLVFMLGFMLTNLYLAYLTSFLAKIIFKPQIETLEELVTNNISILIRDFEIPLVLRNRGLPSGFERLLVPISSTNQAHLPRSRWPLKNQTFAYTTTDDESAFILIQQVHLKRPLYKVVEETVSTIPIGFLMAKHSPFEVILNRFILRINSAGLLFKWWNDMYLNGIKAGILQILKSNSKPGPPLTMEHFKFAWLVLGGGLGVATIFAVFEALMIVLCRFKVMVVYR